MFVLGTCGHVDHGKSSFLRLLTGQEPDRLPEEKKRGMTIDLNFVWTELAGQKVGIVDVPGHHRFVKNMISGVMHIDAFIFIVAADDGWMPQSEEHFRVVKEMGLKEGLAIITKVDLASEEQIQKVENEVRAKLEEIGSVPLYRFTCVNPVNLAEIRSALKRLIKQLPKPLDRGAARLWVDRVFVPKGQGIVVTGTLREGHLAVGDEVKLYPEGHTAIVKSLHAYQQNEPQVQPVSRAAVQLSRVDISQVKRGQLLLKGLQALVVDRWDSRMKWFESPKKDAIEVSLHLGTSRYLARITLLDPKGEYARFYSDELIPVRSGERFLLRTVGEERTLATGEIIDCSQRLSRFREAPPLLRLWSADLEGSLKYWLAKEGALSKKRFFQMTAFVESDLESAVKTHGLKQVAPDWLVDKSDWAVWTENAKAILREKGELSESRFTQEFSAKTGKKGLPISAFLMAWVTDGTLKKAGNGYGLLGQTAVAPADDGEKKRLMDLIRKIPLTKKEIEERLPQVKSLLIALVQNGEVVALPESQFVARQRYQELQSKVQAYLKEKGQATTSELKTYLSLTRKTAIPLLEKMDSDRLTYLKDGVRRLLKS